MEISEESLRLLEYLSSQSDPPPWISVVEGRDQLAGDSFIQVGEGANRCEDIYVIRETRGADSGVLDLIAAARTYLPALVAEVRRLRQTEFDPSP